MELRTFPQKVKEWRAERKLYKDIATERQALGIVSNKEIFDKRISIGSNMYSPSPDDGMIFIIPPREFLDLYPENVLASMVERDAQRKLGMKPSAIKDPSPVFGVKREEV